MKATLTFNLPEENSEFECASKGTDLACFQFEVFSKIREYLKYGRNDKGVGKEAAEILEELRNHLNDEEVKLSHFN